MGAVGALGNLANPQLSHDGRRVAVSVANSQGGSLDVWIYDLARNTPTRFTFDPAIDFAAIWSRDDSRIVFGTSRKNLGDLYVKDSAGMANDPGSRTVWDLWTYSTENRKATPFLQTPFNDQLGRFSPDGRWITYTSNESGREEVYVVPFPGPGGKWQVSTGGGRTPAWTRGGREIVYQAPGKEITAVEVQTNPSFQAGIPKALFKTNVRPPPGGQFDVTPDGERFLVNLLPGDQMSDPVTLVQNWAAERRP